jgi:hypothetical protein
MKPLFLMISIFLISCSTSKKNKSFHSESVSAVEIKKSDSSNVTNNDNSSVKKTDIKTDIEKHDEYSRETTITFDPADSSNDNSDINSTPAADYFPSLGLRPGPLKQKPYPGRIKTIVIKETGTQLIKDKSISAGIETIVDKSKSETKVVKSDESKTNSNVVDKKKSVFRIDGTGLIVFSICLFLLVMVCYYYRKELKLLFVSFKLFFKK